MPPRRRKKSHSSHHPHEPYEMDVSDKKRLLEELFRSRNITTTETGPPANFPF